MNNLKNIVWLASYPKSGNTWFRAFLSALLSQTSEVNINSLNPNYHFIDSELFEQLSDLNASELYPDEVDVLKPQVFNEVALSTQEKVFVKVHEKYHYNTEGKPIIPSERSKVALYFIRNPLDVAVSFAHHENNSIPSMIKKMGENETLSFFKKNPDFFLLMEQLGSWSEHVNSWVNNSELPVEVIRYEDMHSAPLQTFSRAIKAAGLDFSTAQITKAIDAASFEKLQLQESANAFAERNPKSQRFFRKGQVGSWKEELTSAEVERILLDHQDTMSNFGYL